MRRLPMAQFAIHPLQRFHGPSQPVKRPREFTCFSYDDDHRLHLDDRSLRWYYPPQALDVDLSRGFDRFDKHDDSGDEHLDSLLAAIAAHEQKQKQKIDAHVVTWRGVMTKIMATPFDDRDGFEMNATFYQDCIFIEENHAYKAATRREQEARQNRPPARPNPNQPWFPPDVMSYWGYKFESLATLPAPWGDTDRDFIESRDDHVVSNKAQYCSIVRTGFGAGPASTVLCLGGEVDAVWDSRPQPSSSAVSGSNGPIHWVELKTSADIRGERDLDIFEERKLLKFWIQSFLLGVPTIVVGFRSRDGFLKRIEEIDTAGIPTTLKARGRARWDADVCVNFAADFLRWLRSVIAEAEDTDGVWRIRRKPGAAHIDVFRVDETGHGSILPDDFLNWRIKLAVSGGAAVEESAESTEASTEDAEASTQDAEVSKETG